MAQGIKVQAAIEEVQARLAAIKAAGGSTGPAVAAFGSVILNRIRLGFRLGRSPWGHAWEPLKLRMGRPLRDTGRLQRSITMQTGPDSVTIGTNLRQAPVHQFGAVITPKKASHLVFPGPGGLIFAKEVTIPSRPFMPLTRANDVRLPPAWAEAGLVAMRRALKL